MKVFIQWALVTANDWQELPAEAWAATPSKPLPVGGEPIDGAPGWVSGLNVQGVVFGEADHYAVEPTADGGVKVTAWADDPEDWPAGERWALVHEFLPLAPDPALGGAINTRQTRTIYGEPAALERLRTNAPTDSFRDWAEFVPPAAAVTRHGIWLPDELFAEHRAARSLRGWREWGEHLPAEELDENGRVLPQRALGRYAPSEHTITWYQRTDDRAVGYVSVNHEDALERTTATAATETVEVPLSTTGHLNWEFSTPANDPNSADWPDGSYRAQWDVTVLDSGVKIDYTRFRRVQSDLSSILADIGTDLTDVTTTGLHLRSVSVNPAAGTVGDRYAIGLYATNSNTHGTSQTITLELNTTDSFADGPWSTATQLSPTGLSNARALGSPTVSPQVKPAALAHTRAQGVPIVSPQVKPAGLLRGRAFGTPTVNPQVLPVGLARTRALGSPTVTPLFTVTPAGLEHTRAQGTPTIMYTLSPASLAHTRAQGTPVLNPSVLPASLERTRVLGAVAATTVLTIGPAGLGHTRAQGALIVSPQVLVTGLGQTRTLGALVVSEPGAGSPERLKMGVGD